jgi:hypothetical protein
MEICRAWPRWLRCVVSIAIVVYLLAVVLPPLAGPPPASLLANRMIQPFRPLIGAVALGHGYRFFAPNPGPGHSFRWTVEMPDGGRKTGMIPDAETDWPRLLYHRRFMLPEKISALVPLPGAPAEVVAEAKREWQPLVKDLAAHLLAREGGTRVELALVEHYLPAPEEVTEGRAGEDIAIPLGTYARPRRGDR